MTWRRLHSDELDHEFIWLAVSGASAVMLGTWVKLQLPLPGCLFHQFTGEPCPTCGATRCFRDLLGGHFQAAFLWNPLAFFAIAGVVLFNIYALAVLLFRLPRARLSPVSPQAANALRVAVITLVAMNWIYLVAVGR